MKRTTIVLAAALTVAMHLSAQTKIKVLHDFGSSNDGNDPSGPLLLDTRGNLYGATGGGPGTTGFGIAFALAPQSNGAWSEAILHTFASADGSPWGGLIFGQGGSLFGTTIGGPVSKSEAYQLVPTSGGWGFNVLYSDGAGPGMVLDNAGSLYGLIGPGDYFGIGAIGELSLGSSGWTYTQLYGLCTAGDCSGGYNPPAPPIWDSNGNLWGTMAFGGITQSPCSFTDGCGVVYELTTDGDGTWTYNVIHQFADSSTDGQFPDGGLAKDAAGNFYGNTSEGGAYNHGTIFKFSQVSGQWVETILYDFPNCVQGCFPVGTMAIDKAGNLYGTTIGGVHNSACGGFTCGEVFEMSPQRNGRYKFTVLHKFVGTDGDTPLGVILDGKGNLFGTTKNGGTYGAGTAFELTP
jgi:uncharacterized repeat protein (TIGR03803 family)